MGLTWLGEMGTVPSGGSCQGSHQVFCAAFRHSASPLLSILSWELYDTTQEDGGWGRAGGFSEEIVYNLALVDGIRVCSI